MNKSLKFIENEFLTHKGHTVIIEVDDEMHTGVIRGRIVAVYRDRIVINCSRGCNNYPCQGAGKCAIKFGDMISYKFKQAPDDEPEDDIEYYPEYTSSGMGSFPTMGTIYKKK